jgi:hypothetical protein
MQTTCISPERRLQALLAAQLRLQQGESPEEAVRFLQSQGLAAHDAQEFIDGLVGASRRENRGRGLLWLGLAAVCFVASAPFVAAVFDGADTVGDAATRSTTRVFAMTATLPCLLIAAGCWLLWRGLRLVLARRYSGNPD